MQVGKLSSYNLQKNFTEFYSEVVASGEENIHVIVPRVLHNQEQLIRGELRDGTASPTGKIKYWNMDGTEAAQFTIGSGGSPYYNILDFAWNNEDEKIYYITMDPALVAGSSYSVYKCLPDGSSPELALYNFNPSEYATWFTSASGGYVQICCSETDTYMKVGAGLYRLPTSALVGSGWSSVSYLSESITDGFHYGNGSDCWDLSWQPVTSSGYPGSGHVLYTWYDSDIDVLYLRSITTSGGMQYNTSRWAMLDIDDFSTNHYPIFINQLDTDSVFYLKDLTASGYPTGSTNLHVFNADEELAAFVNVNSSDVVLPAGINAQAQIRATVINCWGTTLSGKLVQFYISSGDGGVNPTYAYTDSNGRAYTTFTAGSNVGTTNIAVVVNET